MAAGRKHLQVIPSPENDLKADFIVDLNA